MKIVLLQSGPDYEVLLIGSMLIGLQKKYVGAEIFWIGEPQYFELLKFNRRVKGCLDISRDITFSTLAQLSSLDLVVNPCLNRRAKQFASSLPAKEWLGFTKNGPVNRQAEFMQKVLSEEVNTHKNILDLYYHTAGLHWSGEGYGLSYYPRQKQTHTKGRYLKKNFDIPDSTTFKLPAELLGRFDVINQFQQIHTDDPFVLHAALALRKETYFYEPKPLNYNIEFFKSGGIVKPTPLEGLAANAVQ